MTEKELQGQVERWLRDSGWLVYHTHDSRKSEPGFPDIVALKGGRLLVLELKSPNGKPSDAQRQWLQAFAAVRGAEVYIVRPESLDDLFRLS